MVQMKSLIPVLFIVFSSCQLIYAQDKAAKVPRAPESINGSYTLRYSNVSDSLDVLLLPDGRVKFELLALLIVSSETRNGEVQGIATLKGHTALYEEGQCKVEIRFAGHRAIVSVINDDACGFGAYVTANGTYTKRRRRPKFDF